MKRRESAPEGARGVGRPLAHGEKLTPRSIRLTAAQMRKLDALGGAAWVRDALNQELRRLGVLAK